MPIHIWEKAGLLPNTEVEFILDGATVRIVRASEQKARSRGERVLRALCGSATIKMTTDEIMALTRGE
ncbi:MAG: AbrB/MazE/SpoVT family DNA-binding domain-containing protein [Alphaproteobacteria bacterium]|nr:AbrB/MazE/SpoVT family DNA-binding domain-containing protein [Alphaproteobacteria bacterium]